MMQQPGDEFQITHFISPLMSSSLLFPRVMYKFFINVQVLFDTV
jgi:hypothetical protein